MDSKERNLFSIRFGELVSVGAGLSSHADDEEEESIIFDGSLSEDSGCAG